MDITFETRQDSLAVKILAKSDGETLGWVYLYVLQNDRHNEPFGLLENLYVDPKTRGQGVGTKLAESAIAEAKKRGCYKLIATSRNSKPELQGFYKKFGLNVWGVEYRMDLNASLIKNPESCEIEPKEKNKLSIR